MAISDEHKAVYISLVKKHVVEDVKPFSNGVADILKRIGETSPQGWIAGAAGVPGAAVMGMAVLTATATFPFSAAAAMTVVGAGLCAIPVAAILPTLAKGLGKLAGLFDSRQPFDANKSIAAKLETELLKINPDLTKSDLGSIMAYGKDEIKKEIKSINENHRNQFHVDSVLKALGAEIDIRANYNMSPKEDVKSSKWDNEGLSKG